MGFFDLNIPYNESAPDFKTNRMKLAIKAMELGYTGVAHNRTIKGVMSDRDRCAIPLLTLSSLLKLAPSLASSVKFHRDLLSVPVASPFRQYTRITVRAESIAKLQVLNSGNPILKTYDLVAVRPLNQIAFDQACEISEVDIISIDFSENVSWRIKQPLVRAAMKRGICFELTYSDLIKDVQKRRQVISKAKLLVEWTRGKNIIISSDASTVNYFRGPNDVANLSSMLGLSMEQAKAAISNNCRSLVAKALKRKYFFKDAIRIEYISSGEQLGPKENWNEEWLKWDPVSSGEGDLLLDDVDKYFSASNKPNKTVKPIDFASIEDSMLTQGFQLMDFLPITKAVTQSPEIGKTLLFGSEVIEVPFETTTSNKLSKNVKLFDGFSSIDDTKASQCFQDQELFSDSKGFTHSPENGTNLLLLSDAINVPFEKTTAVLEQPDSTNLLEGAVSSSHHSPSQDQNFSTENSLQLSLPTDISIPCIVSEEIIIDCATEAEKDTSDCQVNVLLPNEGLNCQTSFMDIELDVSAATETEVGVSVLAEKVNFSAAYIEQPRVSPSDVNLSAENIVIHDDRAEIVDKICSGDSAFEGSDEFDQVSGSQGHVANDLMVNKVINNCKNTSFLGRLQNCSTALCAQSKAVDEVMIETSFKEQHCVPVMNEVHSLENLVGREEDVSVAVPHNIRPLEINDGGDLERNSVGRDLESSLDLPLVRQVQSGAGTEKSCPVSSLSGAGPCSLDAEMPIAKRRRISGRGVFIPFKPLLSSITFKRRPHKSKGRTKPSDQVLTKEVAVTRPGRLFTSQIK